LFPFGQASAFLWLDRCPTYETLATLLDVYNGHCGLDDPCGLGFHCGLDLQSQTVKQRYANQKIAGFARNDEVECYCARRQVARQRLQGERKRTLVQILCFAYGIRSLSLEPQMPVS
jgi:hypothetical protein